MEGFIGIKKKFYGHSKIVKKLHRHTKNFTDTHKGFRRNVWEIVNKSFVKF